MIKLKKYLLPSEHPPPKKNLTLAAMLAVIQALQKQKEGHKKSVKIC